jgi:hypothetical protein
LYTTENTGNSPSAVNEFISPLWKLGLREEHRFAVFKNRVLRRIFGPKRD